MMAEIKIADRPDLTVTVWEYEDILAAPGQEQPAKKTDFLVNKEILRSNSDILNTMLREPWMGPNPLLDLKEDTHIKTAALEIWFRSMHNTLTDSSYAVPRPMLWSVTSAGDKYGFKFDLLREWFKQWYTQNEENADLKRDKGHAAYELLFPCWAFDHAAGFLRVTKWLVYNCGMHIIEQNPTPLRYHHLPPRVIQQLNAARGRLKTVLHDKLWQPIETPLRSGSCNCKEKSLFEYQRAMLRAGVWPLERTFTKASVAEILELMSEITYTGKVGGCWQCRIDVLGVVKEAIHVTERYFDGICLRCVEKTTERDPDSGSSADDYWSHHTRKEWDRTCRQYGIRHGEPTWYFSYMGRKHKDAREDWYKAHR